MIGTTLGHYEITGRLGKGGMGEVYRAKDQKLGREVAIKVLPEEFARDADRVARFQREAKLLASLNHPNIAAIYGLEESAGSNFLVLELVEGNTLADRIKADPIPLEESLKLALQIAEALEAAHEKGVIHRDLKPANIKVTPDAKVKVLDFGLAKAFAGDQAEMNLSNSPTLSNAATQQGVILGTAAYMSPEQAKGRIVDKRADIWAFGCVLYEILTGKQAFQGEDVSTILAAVIRAEPDWSALPANLHWRLRELLERCLTKDARNRYGSISDARVDIQKVLSDPGGVPAQLTKAAEQRRMPRAALPWVAVAVALGAIICGFAVWKLKTAEPRQVVRFDFELPEEQQINPIGALAVSPDGKNIAYGTAKGLYLRSVDELTARLIPGTEGPAWQPFFSPDGRLVGYYSGADRKLKKIVVSGGAPETICDVASSMRASWHDDDTIVYAQLPPEILRISAKGGTPKSLVKLKSGLIAMPQLLPGGKSLLYVSSGKDGQYKVIACSLQSGDVKELFAGIYSGYLQTGHIIYQSSSSGALLAIPFDADKLEVRGDPVSIVEQVQQYAVSDSGTLVYVQGTVATVARPQRHLVWVDRHGKEESIAAPPDVYAFPRVSPDGTRVAVTIGSSNSNLWIWDLNRGTKTRLTFEETKDVFPLWTRDGKRLVFCSIGKQKNSIYWKAADGTGKDEMIISLTDELPSPSSWSQDGKTLVLEEIMGVNATLAAVIMNLGAAASSFEAGGGIRQPNAGIGELSMEGDHTRKMLLKEYKFSQVHAQISPDGRWIAYMSTETGRREVYVRPFPRVDSGKCQVSTGGGWGPRWSPNGRELFYRSGDAMMAVPVSTESTFRAGTPEKLFQGPYYSARLGHQWDLNPDGKCFLMIKEGLAGETATPGGRQRINVILNWAEELKARVPVK